ncbi:MAG: 2-phosphosulfolactate phosphatase [Bacteroidetes bacterium]|nr:2-phosphosulfolactate phosphatase [Bacteroidota bacterium]
MTFNQSEYDIKLEWGLHGIEQLTSVSDVIIIVDILSFSTCVDIAVSHGAIIYPYRYKDESAIEYAKSLNAELADANRNSEGFTLSPLSLKNIPPGTKLVLPSPNGATLSLATGNVTTICGGLRNPNAVAEYAMSIGKSISVIPAGEKWQDGSLRFAIEDYIGAGAIISYLKGILSPESKSALAVYQSVKENLLEEIKKCSSGKELVERGFEEDVNLACEFNVSECVPFLKNGAYENIRSL